MATSGVAVTAAGPTAAGADAGASADDELHQMKTATVHPHTLWS